MIAYSASNIQLPWSISNDDERFNKILRALFIIYIVVTIPILFINLPELTRAEKEQLPPQLARIMLEKQVAPPPPKPIEKPKAEEKKTEEKVEEKPQEKIEKKPVEKKVIEKVIERPVEKTPVVVKVNPNAETAKKAEAVVQARERATNSGLMALKSDLQDMRDAFEPSSVTTATTTKIGSGGGEGTATQMDRSMITSGVTTGSGGINVAAYSKNISGSGGGSGGGTGGGLAGRKGTKVTSGLAEAGRKAAAASGEGGGNGNGGAGVGRSEEEVRKVMEQHKSSIFNIYNRALRTNAALQGKVVIKIIIDPSGQIVDATIVSSELKDPDLEAKLLQRIKLITFSSSNVARTTLNYSFDFLPQ
jgi:periplasmic protein TonB